jgi:hypothetical protein
MFGTSIIIALAPAVLVIQSSDVIHVPGDAPTIQAGIDMVKDGQTVLVAPGTYHEAIRIEGKTITLASSAGPKETIIDASGLDASVIWMINSPDSVIRGFTITGGSGYGNHPIDRYGGGMFVSLAPRLRVEDCIITGNRVNLAGGGVLLDLSYQANFHRVVIEHNEARNGGGILMINSGSSHPRFWPRFIQCTFRHNIANQGAGLNVNTSSRAHVIDCFFESNRAIDGDSWSIGGAVAIRQGNASVAIFKNSYFINNTADHTGGAIIGRAFIDNCIFESNLASINGGAVSLPGYCGVWFSRFTGNIAGERGGAIHSPSGWWTTVLSCDFQDNAAGTDGGAIVSATNMAFENNVFCLNTPDHIAGPFSDSGGNHFFEQCPMPQTLHVPGEYATIQDAINASLHGDEIIVAPGVYHEAINLFGKRVALIGSHGAAETVIDAGGNGSVLRADSGEGEGTRIQGFTLTGGTGTMVGSFALGGAIYMSRSRLAVNECRLVNNHPMWHGGGVFALGAIQSIEPGASFRYGGILTIAHSTVRNNSANWGGGLSGVILATDTDISDNAAGQGGGVLARDTSRFIGCTFRRNTASSGSIGGLLVSAPDGHEIISVGESLFCANTPEHYGGGTFDDLGGNLFLDKCPPESNPADLNCDGVVDVLDLLILLDAWGACQDCTPGACPADLNGDCSVDVLDLLIVLDNWG